jgi:hypothetical protein
MRSDRPHDQQISARRRFGHHVSPGIATGPRLVDDHDIAQLGFGHIRNQARSVIQGPTHLVRDNNGQGCRRILGLRNGNQTGKRRTKQGMNAQHRTPLNSKPGTVSRYASVFKKTPRLYK